MTSKSIGITTTVQPTASIMPAVGKKNTTETMSDPRDTDSRAPWNEPEPPCLNYYDEADYHEEHDE